MKITIMKSANGHLHDLSWEIVQTWTDENDPTMPSTSAFALEDYVWELHPNYWQQQDAKWATKPGHGRGANHGFYYRIEDENGWHCYAMLIDFKYSETEKGIPQRKSNNV